MVRYRNLSGDVGIEAYEILPDAIRVQFEKGGVYTYSHASAGASAIDEMERLAKAGDGLTTYINQHKANYERKD